MSTKLQKDDLSIAILSGGKSSRMGGGIKCLKKFNNCSFIDRIIQR